jgi:hypothetical protein
VGSTRGKHHQCVKEEQRGSQENEGSTCQGSSGKRSTRKDRPGKTSTGESYPRETSNQAFSRKAGQGFKTCGKREEITLFTYFLSPESAGSSCWNRAGDVTVRFHFLSQ